MNDYLQLKKRDTLKFGIKDENGKPKKDKDGHEVFIEFDLEDITLPDRYNKAIEIINRASATLKNDIIIIDKKQDVKRKDNLSTNTEAKLKAFNKYYKTCEQGLNLFLGKNAISKIFGEVRYFEMFDDLIEMLNPILPQIKINSKKIEEKIKNRYSIKDSAVLKDE